MVGFCCSYNDGYAAFIVAGSCPVTALIQLRVPIRLNQAFVTNIPTQQTTNPASNRPEPPRQQKQPAQRPFPCQATAVQWQKERLWAIRSSLAQHGTHWVKRTSRIMSHPHYEKWCWCDLAEWNTVNQCQVWTCFSHGKLLHSNIRGTEEQKQDTLMLAIAFMQAYYDI